MKLSIITPSLNHGRYIRDCIESVRMPEGIQAEHIIIDGGSTDQTLEVLKHYRHLRWVSEPDLGQSDALNKGIAMATSEYILWLNADDYMLPGSVECLLRTIEVRGEINYIHGHTLLVDENRHPLRTIYHIRHRPGVVKYGSHIPPSTGSLFRAELMRSNPLDGSYHYLMDVEWFLRCAYRLRPASIDRTTVAFRVSPDSKTGKVLLQHDPSPQQLEERHRLRQQYGLYRQTESAYRWSTRRHVLRLYFRLLYYLFKSRYAIRFWRERTRGRGGA